MAGNSEVCDGVDNDCNAVIDDAPQCVAPQVPALPPIGLALLAILVTASGMLSLRWIGGDGRA